MPKVSITKCDNYEQSVVDSAIHEVLAPLGGISAFVKPGQKVLIKPNILASQSPDQAVTTHPAIITAVVKEVVKAGGIALVGDSPGNTYANVLRTLEQTGVKKAAEDGGGKIVLFQSEGVTMVKGIPIAGAALEADVIINLPKLKTHNLTLYTGAIKNMFGCVPGFYKSQFHVKAPHPDDFAKLLVNVFEIVRPTLNIMDAVVGMEGKGPGAAGTPRPLAIIMASTDAVALDAVGSYLIGFKPEQIGTTVTAYKRGLGEMSLEKIKIIGVPLEKIRQANWKKPVNIYQLSKWFARPLALLIKPLLGQLQIDPFIDQGKCTQCLVCYKNCPAKTINYEKEKKIVEIDLKNCIHCFCCHELCEYSAVELKRSWLVKLMGIE
ncbi:MAG: DUF362 domain-containing protein [Candidatus Margulisbacteria bacterium]|nr:DUF362 domain-containing protein [Candidatus Margulisiibacteriota bacterium]